MRFLRSFLLLCAILAASVAPSRAADIEASGKILNVVTSKSTVILLSEPASTIFIANPEIADVQVVTPTRVMILGKKIGETTLMISNDLGRVLANRTVVVSTDIAELNRALKNIAPNDDITARAVPNGVILSGFAKNATTVEMARRIALRYIPVKDGDIINNIKTNPNNQIQIQVRFAEVSREVDKRFGINWENIINTGAFAFSLGTGPDFYSAATGLITRSSVGDSLNDSLNISYSEGGKTINAMIDALAKNGLITILAEPTLTAMSGETASFLAGGEFPVPVPQGTETISIEWKQYGVSLAFTPTLLSNGRINLHVRPEVSQLSTVGSINLSNIEIPALTTRRAETTVELGSGQSFAIAGLLNNNQTQAIEKFPFLGDIPILGTLFRSTRFQNNESELVIIITPYIVKPTTQEKLALPTDGYKQPTDLESLLQHRTTSNSSNVTPISGTPRAVKVSPSIEDVSVPHAAPTIPVSRPMKKMNLPVPSQKKENLSVLPTKALSRSPLEKLKKTKTPRISTPESKKTTKAPHPIDGGGFIME